MGVAAGGGGARDGLRRGAQAVRRLQPSGLVGAVPGGGAASFGLLTVALRDLPVGTAYAVWTGVGAVGTALVGIVFLGDAASAARLSSIALIVGGVVGLNLAGGGH